YLFAVGDVALVETNYCPDLVFGEDRVTFNFELAETINLSFHDRDCYAQSFIYRGQKRQRQNRETRATRANTLHARLAVARLSISLRTHVVVDGSQIVFEFLAVKNVRTFEASDQTGFFDVLHRP